MSNLLDQAKQLHLAGHVDRALALYLEIVEADPQNCDAHNMLGNARADQGRWLDAERAYRRALAVASDKASVHYNLGNALFAQGRFSDAVSSYARAIDLNPQFAAAHFNLGNLYYDLRQWEQAAGCYRQVLQIDADHPDPDAMFNLARALHRRGDVEQAVSLYQQAVSSMSDPYAPCSALAAALLDLQQPEEALQWHRRALELRPEASEAHFHLGRTLLAMGRFDEAEQVLRTALKMDPHDPVIFEALGLLLEMSGKQADLIALAEEVEQANPDDPRIAHLKAAWTGQETPARASDEYVRATFDNFASQFDGVLEKLDYRAPELLAEAILARCGQDEQKVDILDAGCGTGLCGPLLESAARRLVGVDLSGRMLCQAEQRRVYDELIEAELTAYLTRSSEQFDVIISADTLVYFGDLQPVVSAAADTLRAGGVLAFTVEKLSSSDESAEYLLRHHGRYCHSPWYVQRVLETAGLVTESLDDAELRKQGSEMVAGLVVVARKPTDAT